MRYREFTQRQSAVALAHPWRYAVFGGALAWLLLLLMLRVGLEVALLGAAVGYLVNGLSMRYGPGRQIATRRLARSYEAERLARLKSEPRFGTKLWHKLAIGFVGLFVLWIAVVVVGSVFSG
ncbi:MAG: hypothetical protein M3Q30_05795 [Actinomycetota bacterium]|nr:hypothetical protein [Actinomycetota bacterium]